MTSAQHGWLMAIAASLAVAPAAVPAKAAEPRPLVRADALRADVDVLERAFRELHPGLRRYLDPAQVDALFTQLRGDLSSDRTLPEVYLAIARFTAKIRCGHTYPNFVNQSPEIRRKVLDATARLPFYFRWFDRRMVVTRDLTERAALPAGAQVLRIDGNPTELILARLLPLARADGSNDDKRIEQLAVTGSVPYEAFDVYYPLVFPLSADSVTLEVLFPGSARRRHLRLHTITQAQRAASSAEQAAARHGDEAVFHWRDLDGGIAYLGMPTWALYDSRWDWHGWLKQHLEALITRNGPALVIDLRGNEGGDDVGTEILTRLIDQDLPSEDSVRLVRYRSVPADLLPHLTTWDPGFKDWGARATDLDEPWPTAPSVHYFALDRPSRSEQRDVTHPAHEHFGGRVFVLVDAAVSSATFQFASAVQRHGLGTLIGRPTGGNRRGINGGAFFFLNLPNSGIEVDLPLIGTFPASPEADAGLIPDVQVERTATTWTSGADPDLAAVRRLLEQGGCPGGGPCP